ncbi:restriction endonuclease subunit S [Rhodanobacter sp. KK11]|jgi:type I restriction enzyme S subunit|uniref:restriction endonuclease subunit S n=1 Tax=Rhodanobacter sp. KK11 TaxID=3083255 RepID=UPI002965D46C|nr:restriction endonuclease subunit S [Rhodanobacter sp. KK11]MDW2981867.1 restriction endonuclease subunit S [Rhodanobacter sp. KK11]
MSLPRYAEYKDSGVPWLGEVPAHWQARRLKTLSPAITVGIVVNPSEYISNAGLPFIYGGDISEGHISTKSCRRITPVDSAKQPKTRLNAGDLLTVRVGAPGVTAVVTDECEGGNCASVMLIRRGDFESGWLCYVMNSRVVRYQVEVVQYGAAQEQFNIGHAINFWVAMPSGEEQSAITAFLDRETGKIDALIAEQEKLLMLLAEKRQATISHAVTRGLNPNAPMKDSGVPWLGEVPAHWNVLMLRRVVIAFEQGWSPECEARLADEQEWGVLKAGCVNGGQFHPDEHKALPVSLEPRPDLEVQHGDVLMSRASGSPQLIGSVACVDHPPARLMLSDKIFRLRLAQDIAPRFFAYAMRSAPLRVQIEQAIGGAEGLANNLPQARIKDFWFAVPPEAEQHEIARHIEQALDYFDSLESQAQRSIALLKERRSALISAAVTGKIDVRQVA